MNEEKKATLFYMSVIVHVAKRILHLRGTLIASHILSMALGTRFMAEVHAYVQSEGKLS